MGAFRKSVNKSEPTKKPQPLEQRKYTPFFSQKSNIVKSHPNFYYQGMVFSFKCTTYLLPTGFVMWQLWQVARQHAWRKSLAHKVITIAFKVVLLWAVDICISILWTSIVHDSRLLLYPPCIFLAIKLPFNF